MCTSPSPTEKEERERNSAFASGRASALPGGADAGVCRQTRTRTQTRLLPAGVIWPQTMSPRAYGAWQGMLFSRRGRVVSVVLALQLLLLLALTQARPGECFESALRKAVVLNHEIKQCIAGGESVNAFVVYRCVRVCGRILRVHAAVRCVLP